MSKREIGSPIYYNPNQDAIDSYNIKTLTSRLSQLLDEMIGKH